MPEPIQPSTTEPAASPPAATATPPAKTDDFDPSKLSSEQLSKVLENQELWKNPRLAGLLESDKQLKKLQKDQETEREKSLTEQKKFEDLANERGTKVTALEQQLQDNKIDMTLTNLLVKESVVDLDGALKLVDRSKLSVDVNGNVTGTDEALASLKTDRAYLFTNPSGQTVGTPSNPSSSQSGQPGRYKFKESQITPAFYKEHEKEIMEAYRSGQIEQDGPPPQ